MPRPLRSLPLRLLHVGDLHITDAGLQNHLDLERIVDEINAHAGDNLDFVFLPGDNADDGTATQFALVAQEMARLKLPWRTIPGDHDFKPRALDAYYETLKCAPLPAAEEINGHVCLFLDVVSAGTGGPDFRLGRRQTDWLRDQLVSTRQANKTVAIFMHTYPADLGDESTEVAALIDDSPVVLVDMGHTHYNELANDGRTIYAATRSTGQIEEGDVGYSFIAIDEDAVSWRFKTLGSPWPFVMITAPSDRRLVVNETLINSGRECEVRASAWGRTPIMTAEYRIDDGEWSAMAIDQAGLLSGSFPSRVQPFRLTVRVVDDDSRTNSDTIEIDPAGASERAISTGSDAGSIGAWPEREIFATQLGPNRNGKKW